MQKKDVREAFLFHPKFNKRNWLGDSTYRVKSSDLTTKPAAILDWTQNSCFEF